MNGEQANAVAAGRWASRMVRLAVASIFAAAVVPKWQHGWASVQGTVEYIRSSFAESWLPGPMVAGYAYAVPFAEALVVLWLLSGVRLRSAWVFSTALMISLAFGMMVLKQYDKAGTNYSYVLLCCAGLYLSQFDGRGRRSSVGTS